MKSLIQKLGNCIQFSEEKMQNALKTIEKENLYASFGLVEDLSDDELMDIEGGDCFINFCHSQSDSSNDSNSKNHNGNGNGSGKSSGSSYSSTNGNSSGRTGS